MGAYDLIMILLIVAATVWGAWKGLAWQVASIASLVVSYFVAVRFRSPVAELIPADSPWSGLLAMLILFLASSLLIWSLFRLVANAIDELKLKDFDRQVGAIFGLAKGVALCVIVTLFAVTLLGDQPRRTIIDSYSGYYIAQLLNHSHAILPDEVHEVLHPYMHSMDERLDESEPSHEHPEDDPEAPRSLFPGRSTPGGTPDEEPPEDDWKERVRELIGEGSGS